VSGQNLEATACERLSLACRSLRASSLFGADQAVAERKRVVALEEMADLLCEFGLIGLSGDVLRAREHFEEGQPQPRPQPTWVHRDAVAFVGGAS
jgi:hypothetical protein